MKKNFYSSRIVSWPFPFSRCMRCDFGRLGGDTFFLWHWLDRSDLSGWCIRNHFCIRLSGFICSHLSWRICCACGGVRTIFLRLALSRSVFKKNLRSRTKDRDVLF